MTFTTLGTVLLCLRSLAPTLTEKSSPQNFVLEGNALYYQGRHRQAIEAYQKALEIDPQNLNARRSGGVVLSELGDQEAAAFWYRQALRTSPRDAGLLTALGEVELRTGDLESARRNLLRALDVAPQDVHALTALGRLELASGHPDKAAEALLRVTDLRPNFTLAHYYLGKAREALGDQPGALAAYRNASSRDSYFTSARYALSSTLFRLKRFHEAYEQASKLVQTAPIDTNYRNLKQALYRHVRGKHRPRDERPPTKENRRPKRTPLPLSPPPTGRVPMLRVGIGTNGMGESLGWNGLYFTVKTPFDIVAAESGAVLSKGDAGMKWKIHVSPSRSMEIYSPSGKKMVQTSSPVRIRPDVSKGGWTYLKETEGREGASLARTLRGELEIALHPRKRALHVVNVVDLESYTQGVLPAEMPIGSPLEALRAQAVIARTHALFVKEIRPRHSPDGYDACDGQHCQVYFGVGSETERSRSVVSATRGRVVTHNGRVPEMLYSSNCGGHSQSSEDLKGWTKVPYFTGVSDAHTSIEFPSSPWDLRNWLRTSPKSYCSPSEYVYPSHYRWTRVVPAEDLNTRLHRALHIGRLKTILPLRRSSSGHINSILVQGTRGSKRVDTEMRIRGLFGIGSQRSSLFIMETEHDSDGNPANYIFYGGGWGHGVGLCQSGAMGRAERGQSYASILKSYYVGTEIGNLRY